MRSRAAVLLGTISPQQAQIRQQELEKAAQAEMQQQRFQDAAQHFRQITCITPGNAQAFYNLGAAQAASGDFAAARISFTSSSQLDPRNALPLVMLVRVNFSLGDTDGLKSALRATAERFPKDAELHAVLARFLTEKNQLDLALAESLRSQLAGGAGSESKVGLAILENSVGAYDEAIVNAVDLERQPALPQATRAAAAGVARHLSYEGRGQRDKAIVHLREAIRLDPTRENSYLALAYLLEKAQKYGDAVAVLEQGRRAAPNSKVFLMPLGYNLVQARKISGEPARHSAWGCAAIPRRN